MTNMKLVNILDKEFKENSEIAKRLLLQLPNQCYAIPVAIKPKFRITFGYGKRIYEDIDEFYLVEREIDNKTEYFIMYRCGDFSHALSNYLDMKYYSNQLLKTFIKLFNLEPYEYRTPSYPQ